MNEFHQTYNQSVCILTNCFLSVSVLRSHYGRPVFFNIQVPKMEKSAKFLNMSDTGGLIDPTLIDTDSKSHCLQYFIDFH